MPSGGVYKAQQKSREFGVRSVLRYYAADIKPRKKIIKTRCILPVLFRLYLVYSAIYQLCAAQVVDGQYNIHRHIYDENRYRQRNGYSHACQRSVKEQYSVNRNFQKNQMQELAENSFADGQLAS